MRLRQCHRAANPGCDHRAHRFMRVYAHSSALLLQALRDHLYEARHGKAGSPYFCSPACRFWGKVDSSSGPDACWPWKSVKAERKRIYASFLASKVGGEAKFMDAHKFAWELVNGPVPEGLNVCHRCDNPICCNPKHHFLGTNADNMQDMVCKGRDRWGSSPSGRYTRA